jgi:hypothetical protein
VTQLLLQNPRLAEDFPEDKRRSIASTILKQCEKMLRAASRAPSECLSLPIFVSGDLDVPEPTSHDREAMNPFYVDPHGKPGNPAWVYLTYDNTKPRSQRDWKDGLSACAGQSPCDTATRTRSSAPSREVLVAYRNQA